MICGKVGCKGAGKEGEEAVAMREPGEEEGGQTV